MSGTFGNICRFRIKGIQPNGDQEYLEKNSRKFRKSTCINVSPYIVIAMERDSHFHSSYIVLAVMNHLRMAYSIQKGVCGFSANVGPFYIGDLNICGFRYP